MATKLARCGLQTLHDLLFHLPFRYQDRTHITPIRDLRANDWAVVVGQVCQVELQKGKRPMLICYLNDRSALLRIRFFHFTSALITLLKTEPLLRVFGEVKPFAHALEMVHPDYQIITSATQDLVDETLTPIYTSTQGLSQSRLRHIIQQALTHCLPTLTTLEWMTPEQLRTHHMPPLHIALQQLHAPTPDTPLPLLLQGTHPAIKRVAFDELLAGHIGMQLARQKRQQLSAVAYPCAEEMINTFLAHLPFTLTQAQQQIFQDICHDLAQTQPMLRLVQGDVGCGKTVVSALAALQVIAQGGQVALMVPTDLLSEQHAQTFTQWFTPLGFTVHRLSGQLTAKTRKQTLAALASGEGQLVIGTHALFQAEVTFAHLGLVIIDEQHRFGVAQRLLLQQKGQQQAHTPHQLFMTATPIPRTLVMTQLAHLDISIIHERPPRTNAHHDYASQPNQTRYADSTLTCRDNQWSTNLLGLHFD